MKITIFETEHFEGAYPVIRLFDIPGNEISIITSEVTYKRFEVMFGDDTSRYTWHVIRAVSKARFFLSLYRTLSRDKPDLFYINTISNNHILYACLLFLLPIKRVVLTIHDINCLFGSRLSWHLKKAIIHLGKRWLIRKVHEFNVVSDTMMEYLNGKAKGKNIHNIPGAVFEGHAAMQKAGETAVVVVPGSVDGRRRKYEQVLELAALANRSGLRLRLVILGGTNDAYGHHILEQAKTSNTEFCKLVTYEKPVVDQPEFDYQMDSAHFVFIPSVINTTICEDIPETYGITKSSGNIFDVIKHAKPFIAPNGLSIPPSLLSSCHRYEKPSSIVPFLIDVMRSPSAYEMWQANALSNSREYTLQKIRERNPSLFNTIQGPVDAASTS